MQLSYMCGDFHLKQGQCATHKIIIFLSYKLLWRLVTNLKVFAAVAVLWEASVSCGSISSLYSSLSITWSWHEIYSLLVFVAKIRLVFKWELWICKAIHIYFYENCLEDVVLGIIFEECPLQIFLT